MCRYAASLRARCALSGGEDIGPDPGGPSGSVALTSSVGQVTRSHRRVPVDVELALDHGADVLRVATATSPNRREAPRRRPEATCGKFLVPGEAIPVGEGADEVVVLVPGVEGALESRERQGDVLEDRKIEVGWSVENDRGYDALGAVRRDVVGEQTAERVSTEMHALEAERIECAEQVSRWSAIA